MDGLAMPEWGEVFVPDLSLAESVLRASLVYLSLVVLFRVVLKRQSGSLGLPDVLLVVLVSECVSQSMTSEAKSVPNGLVAVLALLFWNYTLDRVAFYWPWLQRRLEPAPLDLIRDGKPLRENLASEGITDEELESQLRLSGVDDVAKVKTARIESEGSVSVVEKDKSELETPVAPPALQADSTDFAAATRQFLAAAEALRKAVAWHEERATDHREAAKSARQVLASHGVRVRALTATSTSKDFSREDAEGTQVALASAKPT